MRKVMCEHDEDRKHCHYCHLDSQSHPRSILHSGETVSIPFQMSLEKSLFVSVGNVLQQKVVVALTRPCPPPLLAMTPASPGVTAMAQSSSRTW